MTIDEILSTFLYIGQKYLVPFSPLIYYVNDPLPVSNRYNFQNIPEPVTHPDILPSLLSEIIGLSIGDNRADFNFKDNLTRRRLAAFGYMLSTMSVPKDLSVNTPAGSAAIRQWINS
ncbi:MAG: hypothetical protein FWE80_01635 [Oscillospiraceae bacterium]|nr:hypothetical protein [Oscillospiraceae bacterium]